MGKGNRERRQRQPGPVVGIAACLPVDQSDLPKIDLPIPGPFIDDTVKTCQFCGREVWVSPKKLALWREGGCALACYFCAVALTAQQEETPMIDLNPGRVEIRRKD